MPQAMDRRSVLSSKPNSAEPNHSMYVWHIADLYLGDLMGMSAF